MVHSGSATDKGLVRSRGGKFETYTTRDGLSGDVVTSLYEDAEGSLWIGTNGGVTRLSARGFDRFGASEGLNHNSVASLAGDREGNVWIGTSGGGVTKLTARSFSTLSRQEGLSGDLARTVLEGRDGTIWIGTQGAGLNGVKDGRVVSAYRMRDGLPGETLTALLEGADGSLWIGTTAGLARLHQGRISVVRADQLPVAFHQGALRGTRRIAVGGNERRRAQDSPGRPRHRVGRQGRLVRCRALVLRRSERHGLGRKRRGTEPLRQRPL